MDQSIFQTLDMPFSKYDDLHPQLKLFNFLQQGPTQFHMRYQFVNDGLVDQNVFDHFQYGTTPAIFQTESLDVPLNMSLFQEGTLYPSNIIEDSKPSHNTTGLISQQETQQQPIFLTNQFTDATLQSPIDAQFIDNAFQQENIPDLSNFSFSQPTEPLLFQQSFSSMVSLNSSCSDPAVLEVSTQPTRSITPSPIRTSVGVKNIELDASGSTPSQCSSESEYNTSQLSAIGNNTTDESGKSSPLPSLSLPEEIETTASVSDSIVVISTQDNRDKSEPASKRTSQTGPIPATKPIIMVDQSTGDEVITFSYTKQKIIKKFSLKKPQITFDPSTLPEDFRRENCIYMRAMVPIDKYKGNRGKYERECNDLGWIFSWFNPEIRQHRGLIQRAVDSWRNTRSDKRIRSRRVRRIEGKTKSFIYC